MYICIHYRDCLHDHVKASNDDEVLCPICEHSISEAEICQVHILYIHTYIRTVHAYIHMIVD